MVSMEFTNTPEQDRIVAKAISGESFVVTAVAGSGKTSTLRLIAKALDGQQLLYLAFNKAIQTDAEKSFPANVTAKTAHSVAYGWAKREQPRLMARLNVNVKPWDAAKTLGVPRNVTIGERELTANSIAAFAQATVGRFCHSADETITTKHIPYEFEGGEQGDFEALILPFARKAWADVTSPNGALKFNHDHYLKLWSIARPMLRYDGILFDEGQDADPAILHVIESQPAQVIMVGDSAQAIYGWRGAVDALERFREMGHDELTLTQSFRFGNAVAEAANRFLALLGHSIEVKGFDQVESTVEPLIDADAVLCRTNAGVIEFAMDSQARGRKVAIVGSTKEIESFTKSAVKLMDREDGGRGFITHPDLSGFNTWSEAREFANGEQGADIRVMVRLIDTYGTDAILEVCANSVNEADADVIVSTAHKAKGREWDSVKIAADFARKTDDEGKGPSDADLMLAYVAVTRAKLTLDYSALEGHLAVI